MNLTKWFFICNSGAVYMILR